MFRTERSFPDGDGSAIHSSRFSVAPFHAQKLCHVIQACGEIGMLGAQALFPDGQRTAIQRLGVSIAVLQTIYIRQVIQA